MVFGVDRTTSLDYTAFLVMSFIFYINSDRFTLLCIFNELLSQEKKRKKNENKKHRIFWH